MDLGAECKGGTLKRGKERSTVLEILIDFAMCLYVVAVVVFFWRQPILTSLLLGFGILAQLFVWREKSQAVMMIAAALLGTPSEMVCIKYGVWSYHAPGLIFGIPMWIPLVWAYLFGLFRCVSLHLYPMIRVMPSGRQNFLKKVVLWGLRIVILLYSAVTISLIKRVIALTYTIFLVPAVIFWHRDRDVLIFIVGGVFGTLGELICMKLGFWHYHYPLLKSIGLPLSLPLAWGLSSVIIGRIAMIWEKDRKKGPDLDN
jgi:hypothetical protein